MGAEQFSTSSTIKEVDEAFAACVDQAFYDYGHAGYTGTIAEKDGFVVFQKPPGLSMIEVENELAKSWDQSYARPSWMTDAMVNTYDDKWGPAVAMQDTDETWHFFGWASS